MVNEIDQVGETSGEGLIGVVSFGVRLKMSSLNLNWDHPQIKKYPLKIVLHKGRTNIATLRPLARKFYSQ